MKVLKRYCLYCGAVVWFIAKNKWKCPDCHRTLAKAETVLDSR